MEIFTIQGLMTLISLVFLQAVLGFDNLLYISLESKKAPAEKQSYVRKMGIGMAIFLRILLLFLLTSIIQKFQEPFFAPHIEGKLHASFNFHSVIVLFGGVFIIYTAIKEIWHMMHIEEHGEEEDNKPKSVGSVIFWIIFMNLIFSFDSILSVMALTDSFVLQATSIMIGGILMIWLANRVSKFLQENRMYEVLGLFILFIVGIMLLTEGGHLAHLTLFGNVIEPMSKTTFYFVIVIVVLVDIVQGQYQKKLIREKQRLANNNGA